MNTTPIDIIAWFAYLLSAVMFVMGLHYMNSPKTARKGNFISAAGMVVAVVMAFVKLFITGFENAIAIWLLIAGIIIGAVAGVASAKRVKMTDMPQLVSVFNTVGGGAAALSRSMTSSPGRALRASSCSSPLVWAS